LTKSKKQRRVNPKRIIAAINRTEVEAPRFYKLQTAQRHLSTTINREGIPNADKAAEIAAGRIVDVAHQAAAVVNVKKVSSAARYLHNATNFDAMKSRTSSIIGIILLFILSSLIIMWELFWRFDSHLDLTLSIPIRSADTKLHTLRIHQTSESSVDTSRRTFVDIKKGITHVSMWMEGSIDTTHFTCVGRYYSEVREVVLSIDSSTQAFLVPNTEHGMPTGWGELVYLKANDSIVHSEFVTPYIGDADKDGRLEIYDPVNNTFSRLDPETGKWVRVEIDLTKVKK
jgi:hypothetical protein